MENIRLVISTGQSRKETHWKNVNITWTELVERLKKTTRTSETQGQYANMKPNEKADIKDVGGFVGGSIKGG